MYLSVDLLASIQNCKTPELRFRTLLTEGASKVELALAEVGLALGVDAAAHEGALPAGES